jgi:hypothetical protein
MRKHRSDRSLRPRAVPIFPRPAASKRMITPTRTSSGRKEFLARSRPFLPGSSPERKTPSLPSFPRTDGLSSVFRQSPHLDPGDHRPSPNRRPHHRDHPLSSVPHFRSGFLWDRSNSSRCFQGPTLRHLSPLRRAPPDRLGLRSAPSCFTGNTPSKRRLGLLLPFGV